jgi:hypothetical protein
LETERDLLSGVLTLDQSPQNGPVACLPTTHQFICKF